MAPRKSPGPLLLTPGAGGDCTHHTLLAIEAAVEPRVTRRMDFDYRKEGRKGPPDRAPKLLAAIDRAVDVLLADTGADPASLILGGRSMGGRMCSMAVAAGLPAAGLILLSYPLRPPKKLENPRTGHFPDLDLPCLFVSGTRDEFGSPDEFAEHLAAIPGPVTTVWLEGARHDPQKVDHEIVAAVVDWLADLP
ncbi:MAG: dienelactone hydrolase [Actinomycetia bacterium]|nr:dienelactone hydrolase [Actinomycetes bacterium]